MLELEIANGTNNLLFVQKELEVKGLHMCVLPPQYMFQNEEVEAFPATGCEEQ